MSQADTIYAFLNANVGMVHSIARRMLGAFRIEEVMSEAYLAAETYLNDKRDPAKKSHGQTVYWWYLQKQLARLRRIGTFEETVDGKQDSSPTIEKEFTETDGFIPDYIEEDVSEGDEQWRSTAPKFFVHLPSFRGFVSPRALLALELLGQQGDWDSKRTRLNQFYACGSSQLRLCLSRDISECRRQIYLCQCLNGCRNAVLVCASSPEEAVNMLPTKYGKLLDIALFHQPRQRNDGCETAPNEGDAVAVLFR